MDEHSTTYPAALAAARAILRFLIPLNILLGAAILSLLVASLVSPWLMTAVVGGVVSTGIQG